MSLRRRGEGGTRHNLTSLVRSVPQSYAQTSVHVPSRPASIRTPPQEIIEFTQHVYDSDISVMFINGHIGKLLLIVTVPYFSGNSCGHNLVDIRGYRDRAVMTKFA